MCSEPFRQSIFFFGGGGEEGEGRWGGGVRRLIPEVCFPLSLSFSTKKRSCDHCLYCFCSVVDFGVLCGSLVNPLPNMSILGSSSFAADKDMLAKVWRNGDTNICFSRKHGGKGEIARYVTSNFYFSHNVFKSSLLLMC